MSPDSRIDRISGGKLRRMTAKKTALPPLLGAALAGCAVFGEPDRELEFVHAPITAVDAVDGGGVAVGLEPMARVFVIHPELSPDPAALIAFARSQRGSGRPVYATVWIRAQPSKRPPRGLDPVPEEQRWPFVIVRLAATPDPRASGG